MIRLAAGTTAGALIERIVVSEAICSSAVLRSIFDRTSAITFTSSHEAESKIPNYLYSLLTHDPILPISGRSFVEAINSIASESIGAGEALKWDEIVRTCFDSTERYVPQDLDALLGVLSFSEGHGHDPLDGILTSTWQNPSQQISLLEALLALPAEHFNFAVSSPSFPASNKLVSSESFANDTINSAQVQELDQSVVLAIQQQIAQVEHQAWNHASLLTTLVKLMDSQQDRVREVLERGAQVAPELVLLAIVRSEKPRSAVTEDLCGRLLAYFIAGQRSGALVFFEMASVERQMLVNKLRDYHQENELNVSRVLDIGDDFKLLGDLLSLQPHYFALDVAALAGRREILNLEKWLETSVVNNGSEFVRAALEFVGHKVRHDLDRQDQEMQNQDPTTSSLTAAIVATFLRALRSQ